MKYTLHATRYTLHATRYTLHALEKLKFSLFLIMFLATNYLFSQTPSGVSINWNSYAGCQQFGEIRENGGKEPALIDNIIDGQCINVCRESTVTYTLSGLISANPGTTWIVTGGTIVSQTPTTCIITWNGIGNGSITFTTKKLNGTTVTKTICFNKIEIPEANFTIAPLTTSDADIGSCVNQTVFFNNLSTTNGGSGLYSYYWDFGDGTSSSAFEPTHIYTASGVYNIKYFVTNSCGCTTVFNKNINVGAKGFEISCPSVVCEGQRTSYSLPTNINTVCGSSYLWSVDGGSFTNLNNGSVDVTWNNIDSSGFGTVSFDPKACNASCFYPSTIRIPVIQTNGTIIGNKITCLNSQERFVLPQWPATEFTWTVLNNVNENLAHVYHTDQRNEVIIEPLVSGELTIRCTYFNTLLHCGGSAEFSLTVIAVPEILGPVTVCQNISTNFNLPTADPVDWEIRDNIGALVATITQQSILNYTFTTTGDYTITVANLSGCEDSVKNITVLPAPVAPAAINGSVSICPTAPYTYTIPGTNVGGLYTWQITGGTFIGPNTGNNVNVQFDASATHSLTAVNQSTGAICSSAPTTLNINNQTINAAISSDFAITCENTTKTYSAIKLGVSPEELFTDGETYTWSIWNAANTAPAPSTGSIISGQNTNNISVLWNNLILIGPQTVTLRLVITKCTLAPKIITKTITINPVADLLITTTTPTICSGETIVFNLSTTNGVVIDPNAIVSWNFGDGPSFSSTAVSIGHQYDNSNFYLLPGKSYNVRVTITNPNGCGSIVASPILVVTVRPSPTAACAITSGGNAYCPPQIINTVLSATVTGGYTSIKWYKESAPTIVLGTATTLTIDNSPSKGFGGYYFRVTNAAGCSRQSNVKYIILYCVPPPPCVITPLPNLTNNSQISCSPPNPSVVCTTCGTINLAGTSNSSSSASSYDIFGPNNLSIINYTGNIIPPPAVGSAPFVPLLPGDYVVFYKAPFTCTNGTGVSVSKRKTITIPYVSDFSHLIQCGGNNTYNIAITDTSPFYAPVLTATPPPTYTYYTSTSQTGPWTQKSTAQNFTLTNVAPGNIFVRLVVKGTLAGVAQSPCEKITKITIAQTNVQTISYLPSPVSCHDTSVKFKVNNLDPTDTYLWTFDGGATNTLPDPSRVFNNSGQQTVTCQITNKYGCDKPLLTINNLSPNKIIVPIACFNGTITSTANASTNLCANNPVTLSYLPANDNCPPATYTWMDGLTVLGTTNHPNNSFIVNTPGFYWVKLETSAPKSCKYSTPNRITPLFNTLPTLDFAPLGTYCRGSEIKIDISTNAPTISWILDGSANSNYNNLTSILLTNTAGYSPGTHTITATATSAAGCVKSVTQTFEIANNSVINGIVTQLISCEPYKVRLTAVGVNGNVSWSNGDSSANNTIEVFNGGPYEATISSGGCTNRFQIDVPKDPEQFMWVFPSGCFTSCLENSGTLIGPSVWPVKQWEWLRNNQVISSGVDATAPQIINQNGTYNLGLTTEFCAKKSKDLNYTVSECRACPITRIRADNYAVQNDGYCSISFQISVINPNLINLPITIFVPGSQAIIAATSFIALPGNNTFYVTAIPINGFNGGIITLAIQAFDPKNNMTCRSEFTANFPSCGNSNRLAAPQDMVSSKLTIAPNPSKTVTAISYDYSLAPAIEVYSMLGQRIANYLADAPQGTWNFETAGLPVGIYVVVMKDKDQIVLQQKLIIE